MSKNLTGFMSRSTRSGINNDLDWIYLPITAHIVRPSDGVGGLSLQELNDAIALLNDTYEPIKFKFFIDGEVRYIDSDDYYDFDSSEEERLTSTYNVENTINIYFFNSLTSNGSSLCGYAYFPPSQRDHIMMANGCTVSSTLPHEVGHYFSLYHTHGKTNTGTTDELVNGSNCDSAGDDICDTPADPNLSGLINANDCSYFGDAKDTNGESYKPFPKNIMSFASSRCRFQFTQQQYERIRLAYETYKTYLSRVKNTPRFTYSENEICENGMINFTNKSSGTFTSIFWEFEGGTPSVATQESVEVFYKNAGKYDVSLHLITAEQDTLSLIKNDIVIVDTISSYGQLDISRGSFEDEGSFTLINSDSRIGFEQTRKSSTDGEFGLMIPFHDYIHRGESDICIIESIVTTDKTIFEIDFDYAYAQYGDSQDKLRLIYRSQCGDWTTLWEKEGASLSTAGDVRKYFVPNESDWRKEKVRFEIPKDIDSIQIAFQAVNDFGNNLYLDNYRLIWIDTTFQISNIEIQNASCNDSNDGQITIYTSGEGNFEYSINGESYQSSSVFSGLAPGKYEVNVKKIENENIRFEDVNLEYIDTRPAKPEINYVGNFLQTNADLTRNSIKWYLNGKIIEGQSSNSLANPVPGTYEVEVASGLCSSFSEPFIILGSDLEKIDIIYPNPTSDFIYLNIDSNNSSTNKIIISDLTGRVLMNLSGKDVIDVRTLVTGAYFLRLITNESVYTTVLLKK